MLAAQLIVLGNPSSASRYSGKVSQLHSIPAAMARPSMSSARSRLRTTSARSSDFAGASVKPQFPMTTVVTPCQQELPAMGSQKSCASRCVCPSTKPGVTTWPSASISRRPGSRIRPTVVIVVPEIPTSARYEPRPDPSTTVPLRITRSWSIAALLRTSRVGRAG